MKLVQRTLALVALVLLFIFCVSNGQLVSVRFLAWESLDLPVFLLLIFAFMTGVILALIGQSLRSVSRSDEKQLRKDLKREQKINEKAQVAGHDNSPSAEPEPRVSVIAGKEGEK